MAAVANVSLSCSAISTALSTFWIALYVLCLPLFVFVLVVWCRRRASFSQADLFTLNIVQMEIVSVAASCCYLVGYYSQNVTMRFWAENFMYASIVGQVYFHDLTCLEWYLAVVRPVTYLRLKSVGGVRIRNVGIAAAWAASAVLLLFPAFRAQQLVYIIVTAVWSSLFVMFCMLSTLLALARPGPGNASRGVDRIKHMALCTMAAVMVALMSRFLVILSSYVLVFFLHSIEQEVLCLVSGALYWLRLPSSLVLPLLFLHRNNKLP